ncbi:MAG: IS200/IS605 family transposase [Puniceicoccales bacterium]
MPSTFLSLHYHLIFSTKNRGPDIDAIWKKRLHEYLGGGIKTLGGHPQRINGTKDHVHLLVSLRATHCLSDVLRDIKTASSKWVNREFDAPDFAWQDGYAAFTVSASSLDAVRQYIENQEQHHKKMSFRDELITYLERSGVEYDPRYLD